MKARPIENLYKLCDEVNKEYSRFHDCDDEKARGYDYKNYLINLGWKRATRFIMDTYKCTPK